MIVSRFAVVAALLVGCAVETEPCGFDFEERGGRCVPIDAPPSYYADEADAAPMLRAGDAEPPPDDNAWADFDTVWVRDTSRVEPDTDPQFPGFDLDAIEIRGSTIHWGLDVVLYEHGRAAGEPAVALGAPDGTPLSLGGEGASIALRFGRDLTRGDQIRIFEAGEPNNVDDQAEVLLCTAADISPNGCFQLGVAGPGLSEFRLP